MIEQKITTESINIPFDLQKFMWYTFSAAVVFFGAMYLLDEFPKIGWFAIFMLVVYIFPSAIAFDVLGEYKDTLNVPKINHPKKVLILILNLLTGWTIIGWLLALYLALSPGVIEVTRVEYIGE